MMTASYVRLMLDQALRGDAFRENRGRLPLRQGVAPVQTRPMSSVAKDGLESAACGGPPRTREAAPVDRHECERARAVQQLRDGDVFVCAVSAEDEVAGAHRDHIDSELP